jgi:molecular chaperone DnaK (HSP70)
MSEGEKMVFGIDLGTTYSCIAYVDEFGKAMAIKDRKSNQTTIPSVILMGKGKITVGEEAKDSFEQADRVIAFAKRYMGEEWVKRSNDNDITDESEIVIDGQKITPHYVSANILEKLRKIADEYFNLKLGEHDKLDAVITVPAYFGNEQITATKQAGQMAGLNVLEVISEPTAAAISYYSDQGRFEKREKTVLVYDLGGGTFDVTLIQFTPDGKLREICTKGNHRLGGKDWDDILMEHVISMHSDANPNDEPTEEDLSELRCIVEKKKQNLSENMEIVIRWKGSSAKVTREEFNRLTKKKLDVATALVDGVLQFADEQKGVKKIDEIILVGGSTIMPQVRECLEEKFHGVNINYTNPHEAVARGAAIYAKYLKTIKEGLDGGDGGGRYRIGEGSTRAEDENMPTEIIRLISHSYGVAAYDGVNNEDVVINLVFAQSTVPLIAAPGEGLFCTSHNGQRELNIELMQNDSIEPIIPKRSAIPMKQGKITDLPNVPKDTPVVITIKVSDDGALTLYATCAGKEAILALDSKIEMKKEEIEAARRTILLAQKDS